MNLITDLIFLRPNIWDKILPIKEPETEAEARKAVRMSGSERRLNKSNRIDEVKVSTEGLFWLLRPCSQQK